MNLLEVQQVKYDLLSLAPSVLVRGLSQRDQKVSLVIAQEALNTGKQYSAVPDPGQLSQK